MGDSQASDSPVRLVSNEEIDLADQLAYGNGIVQEIARTADEGGDDGSDDGTDEGEDDGSDNGTE